MRFIHVEDYFIPNSGYQVNLLTKLQVSQGHEVIIVCSELRKVDQNLISFFKITNKKDEDFSQRTGVKIIRIPLLGFYSSRSIYNPIIFKTINELNPDALFVHGEDTLIGIQYIYKSSKLKFPLILDCHMLEMASQNRFAKFFRFFYKNLITPIILKNNIPLIRVVDSNYVDKCLGIPLEKTFLHPLGTDTTLFRPGSSERKKFRDTYEIDNNSFVIVYAGKLDSKKGGKLLSENIIEKFSKNTYKEIVFLIIGDTNGEYGKAVETDFNNSKNRIIRLPTQEYFDLAEFYQASDLAVYPKQCSLSYYDVQACEVPVLFEENEINNKRLTAGGSKTFLAGSGNNFRLKIQEFIDMDKDKVLSYGKNARIDVLKNYDFVKISKDITDLMLTEINRYKNK